ncbi:competence protein ComK [Pontibacillus salicampi]|uniref:Competence protein ComK n=1 Tax=Pontibacillus salicampi TaxID=1449801 RepID=A0ABV6LMA1_9BACI
MEQWKTEFEVSPYTLAILAEETDEGDLISFIVEKNESFYVKESPKKIIDQACKFFGSSLRGRQDGTKDVCGITHKAPIAIDPASGMYFFPTTSPQNKLCSWIAHSHIDYIKRSDDNLRTIIAFTNQKAVALVVSQGSIGNQIQRTAQFRYKLNERLQYSPRHGSHEQVAEPFG